MKRVPDEEPMPKDPAQENIDALDMIELRAFEGQNHQRISTWFWNVSDGSGFACCGNGAAKDVMSMFVLRQKKKQCRLFPTKPAANAVAAGRRRATDEALAAQFVDEGMQNVKQLSAQISGQGPDPLVQLKEQELQIRAQGAV